MSRSGYSEGCDGWDFIRWRGAVASAIRGKRGQAFLRELADALDAMPVKELISGELEQGGKVCALGSVGKARGVDMSEMDPEDRDGVADTFGIAPALVAEIEFENDDAYWHSMTDAQRWTQMRRWVGEQLA